VHPLTYSGDQASADRCSAPPDILSGTPLHGAVLALQYVSGSHAFPGTCLARWQGVSTFRTPRGSLCTGSGPLGGNCMYATRRTWSSAFSSCGWDFTCRYHGCAGIGFLASDSSRYGLIGIGNYCGTIGLIGRLLVSGVLGNFHAVLVYSIFLYGQCFSLGRELCVALCVNRPLSFRIQHMLSIFTVGKLELRSIIGQLISFIVWQWCFSLSVYSGSYWSWDFCVAFVNGATSIRTFWCEVPRRLGTAHVLFKGVVARCRHGAGQASMSCVELAPN